MSENIFPLEVFDFGVYRYSIMDITSIQKKIQLYWFEMTIQKLELRIKTLISKFSQKVFLVFFDVCSSWTWLRFRKIEYLDF